MGFYERRILPLLIEWSLGSRSFARERTRLLAPLHGQVLEIGFGTGLNLPHYPEQVEELAIIDPAEVTLKRTRERLAAACMPIDQRRLGAEGLPFEAGRFDYVVSTWTLCTIPDPVAAMREVRRVLKPDGRFIFLEHGLSADPAVARWQDRLNPLQKAVGGGCHLNRRIDAIVEASGLELRELDRFHWPGTPATHGTMYRGIARR